MLKQEAVYVGRAGVEGGGRGGRGPRPIVFDDDAVRPCLTQCVDYMILGRQLLRKIVDLLFTIASGNNKLNILWGS